MARTRSAATLRLARESDVPALRALIERSARALSRGFYTTSQAEAAIRHVFGVNSALIADGTYFVAIDDAAIVGCGGWSRRGALYGGDQRPMGAADTLDPRRDAARVRAFFVAPEHARRGIGRLLYEACEAAARSAGFSRLELMATLPGVPLYASLGFREIERVSDVLPDGTRIEFVRMENAIRPTAP